MVDGFELAIDALEDILDVERALGAEDDACPVGSLGPVSGHVPCGVADGSVNQVLLGVESELFQNMVPLVVSRTFGVGGRLGGDEAFVAVPLDAWLPSLGGGRLGQVFQGVEVHFGSSPILFRNILRAVRENG